MLSTKPKLEYTKDGKRAEMSYKVLDRINKNAQTKSAGLQLSGIILIKLMPKIKLNSIIVVINVAQLFRCKQCSLNVAVKTESTKN